MICPYCQEQAEFISSKDFYGTDYRTNLYVCRPCDARVGTHGRGKTPLGTMANAELRELRKLCHARFDVRWKYGKVSRSKAYQQLADMMGLTRELAHIGMFDKEQCKKLLSLIPKETKNMSNLAAMAQKLLAEGFDPKTSPVDDYEALPEGGYDVVLSEVQWRVNDKGTEWLQLDLEILNEGYENRKHFGMIFFTEKMMERALKQTMKCASALDIELDPSVFGSPETDLVNAFKEALGTQCEMDIKHSKSKNGTFVNFSLSQPEPF
ncbi:MULTISPECIES: zinc-finger-containing protein [unclassified Lysinibacillus]|uniref:zinc-finger-containing protein n=1 Tax=unclassified Lysinibacillus TaxID=2636778 RepID=UPI003820851F